MNDLQYIGVRPGYSSLVLTMPHSATTIPDGIKHNLKLGDEAVSRTLRAGIDNCVPFVTGFHEYNSAARIWSKVPRVVIDVNRLSEQADKYAVVKGPKNIDAHGMIWRATLESEFSAVRSLLKRAYRKDEFKALLNQVYHPYVESVQAAMQTAHGKFGIAIHFDLHSIPGNHRGYVTNGKYKGAYLVKEKAKRGKMKEGNLPELLLLDQGPKFCSRIVSDKVVETFEKSGILIERGSLRKNTKAPNRVFTAPEYGFHSLPIEIVGHLFEPNRAEGGLEYDSTHERRLRNAFTNVFEDLEAIKR